MIFTLVKASQIYNIYEKCNICKGSPKATFYSKYWGGERQSRCILAWPNVLKISQNRTVLIVHRYVGWLHMWHANMSFLMISHLFSLCTHMTIKASYPLVCQNSKFFIVLSKTINRWRLRCTKAVWLWNRLCFCLSCNKGLFLLFSNSLFQGSIILRIPILPEIIFKSCFCRNV